jgi:hypothetical protein
LRIVLLCNDDLTTNLIFAPIFDVEEIEVGGVYFDSSPSRKHRTLMVGAISLLKRMSFRYWIYLVATNLLYKIFDALTVGFRLSARCGEMVSLRRLAQMRGIPYASIPCFSDPAFIEELRKKQVDLLLIRISEILKPAVLECPRVATWCVHSSLLPACKGIAGEFHGLRHPGMPIGSSIFLVTPKLDEGPTIAQTTIPRMDQSSVFHHMIRNNRAAGTLLVELCRDLLAHRIGEYPLPGERLTPSYFSWPQPDQVQVARKNGLVLIHFIEWWNLLLNTFRLCKDQSRDEKCDS